MPIREELSLDSNFYQSLDEGDIDVTQERIDDARKLEISLKLFRLVSTTKDSLLLENEKNSSL